MSQAQTCLGVDVGSDGPRVSLVLGKGSPCWLLEAFQPRCLALPWGTMFLFSGFLFPPVMLLNFPNSSHIDLPLNIT